MIEDDPQEKEEEPEVYVANTHFHLPVATPQQAPILRQDKVFISIDSLRLVGYSLRTVDPRYTEDTFEIVNWYQAGKGEMSSYAKEVLGQIQLDKVIELRYGSYKQDLINKRQAT